MLFSFRDVLRKHLQNCPGRIAQDLEMPEQLAAGKKLSACDQCANAKKACNRKCPCSTCTMRQKCCTFQRCMSSEKSSGQVAQETPKDKDNGSDANYDFLDDMSLAAAFAFADPLDMEAPDWDWNMPLESHLLEDSLNLVPSPVQNIQTNVAADYRQPNGSIAPIQGDIIHPRPFDFLLFFIQASGLRATFNYNRHVIIRRMKLA